MQQNQPSQNHNMGMNSWPQPWQNIQNAFAQQRPFAYWPQWGTHYPMNITPGNSMLSHQPMPFHTVQVPSYGFPSQMNSNCVPSDSSGGPHSCTNINNVNNIGFENVANKSNPPLPEANQQSKPCTSEEGLKAVENPDKIPLPDGPPPSTKIHPPLPQSSNSNVHSHMQFFNTNSQPIKFNLNQNKSFTPFNLTNNKKNKRKKNKNQAPIQFSPKFSKPNMTMNFTPPKLYCSNSNNTNTNVSQNCLVPPLPPGNHTNQITDCKNENQETKCKIDQGSNGKEVTSMSLMQNQQPSHDDWPPSLL